MNDTMTVTVLTDRLGDAMKELDKLARRARRYGCPDITVTKGEQRLEKRQITDWDGATRRITVSVTDLHIEGDAPRVGDHEFLARVEFDENGDCLVDTRPGIEDLDARFRHTDATCEHCRTSRPRKQLYVVRDNTTGEQIQVGRSCLRDHMGIDDPKKIAQRFTFFARVRDAEETWGRWGGGDTCQSIEGLLTLAATAIRVFGWASKGMARADESLTATATHAQIGLMSRDKLDDCNRPMWQKLQDAIKDAPGKDAAVARRVVAWVRDDLVADNEYTHNLKVLLAKEVVTESKRVGLIVSAVAAYHRAQERELAQQRRAETAAKSEFMGTVGERLRAIPVALDAQRFLGAGQWGDRVLIKFRDEGGNLFSWFTNEGCNLEVGEACVIDGTVKKHNEFRGAKETVLTRVKVA